MACGSEVTSDTVYKCYSFLRVHFLHLQFYLISFNIGFKLRVACTVDSVNSGNPWDQSGNKAIVYSGFLML